MNVIRLHPREKLGRLQRRPMDVSASSTAALRDVTWGFSALSPVSIDASKAAELLRFV